MAIIVGDIHGNVEKVKAFLSYKPEEVHVALGDYLDSFHEPQVRQIESLQLLLDSDSILLWGNHDFNYHRVPPFFSTGYQFGLEEPYQQLIENHIDRFKAAYSVDDWLCTHAGLAKWLANDITNVNVLADMLNDQLAEWMASPCETLDGIFAIGKSRGGSGRYNSGGIFWFDFKREGDRLANVKQIFGHTETKEPVVTENYVALDTTNCKNNCWLYDTAANKLVQLPLEPKEMGGVPMTFRELPVNEILPFARFIFVNGHTLQGSRLQQSLLDCGFDDRDYQHWKLGEDYDESVWVKIISDDDIIRDDLELRDLCLKVPYRS
ncbi:MAG: metallophosphoesterase [Desulfuromonadales bacterium]|nr:metallophosphoesterase [Desulfuromonadales bacterium]